MHVASLAMAYFEAASHSCLCIGLSKLPMPTVTFQAIQPRHHSVGRCNEWPTGNGFGHHWGRNGEFCVAVGPCHQNSIVCWLIVYMYAIKLVRGLKGQRGWALSWWTIYIVQSGAYSGGGDVVSGQPPPLNFQKIVYCLFAKYISKPAVRPIH